MLAEKIPVAMEGVPFIGIFSMATLIFAVLDLPAPSLVMFACGLFCLYFFRDPERVTPIGKDVVVSPADGRVIEITSGSEGAIHSQDTLRISIFMNVFNVHVNRSPITGEVMAIRYNEGAFLSADKYKALIENEKNALHLRDETGFEMTVTQVAGLIARRIVCWAEVGDTLKGGQRFGLIRFGSRLDVYLPKDVKVQVKKGQKVWAGQTVLCLKNPA